jgi:hypothetical protein
MRRGGVRSPAAVAAGSFLVVLAACGSTSHRSGTASDTTLVLE